MTVIALTDNKLLCPEKEEAALRSISGIFGTDECERLKRINNPRRRAESIGGSISLMKCLHIVNVGKSNTPTYVRRDASGRPFFCDTDLPDFSITHQGALSAAAMSSDRQSRVGIDIEALNGDGEGRSFERLKKIAERYFTDAEKARITLCNEPLREFFKIWTAKEAYAKQSGIGLASLVFSEREDLCAGQNKKCFSYFAVDYANKRYILTLCTDRKEKVDIICPSGVTAERI